MTYPTWQVEIEHQRGRSCELGRLNGLLLEFGGGGRIGKEGHMENHEHTPKLELD